MAAAIMPAPNSPIVNALSVDVEDYYQVQALSRLIPREVWKSCESRVERNTRTLLEIFAAANVKGTFFTLGWIADVIRPSCARLSPAAMSLPVTAIRTFVSMPSRPMNFAPT